MKTNNLCLSMIILLVLVGCSQNSEQGLDTFEVDVLLSSSFDAGEQGVIVKEKSALQGDPCTPPTSQVVITELMIDPVKVADNVGEWIELHNPGGTAIDLKNWIIKDNSTDTHKILASVTIPAGGYVTLCRNSDPQVNGGVTCAYALSSGFTLTNTGDAVILINDAGFEIDRIEYTGIAPSGRSVSLRHPFLNNATLTIPANPNDPKSWENNTNFGISTTPYGQGDFGTPGQKNVDVWVEQEVQACADGNICTWDLCEAGKCKNPFKPDCCLSDADCDDGKDCTSDKCDVNNHLCTHTKIEGCCSSDADCVDANPCNFDWCHPISHQCVNSAYNVVPGCCWADPVTNPKTGKPWSSPQERQAYADEQCSNYKDPCKTYKCDLDAFQCVVDQVKENCCTSSVQCEDGDYCTYDTCEQNTCIHTLKSPDCCTKDEQCFDNGTPSDPYSCTEDKCILNICRHFWKQDACCISDNDCPDDGNPCTEQHCIGNKCQVFYKAVCQMKLPYHETFNNTQDLGGIGWKIVEYTKYNNAKDHWVLSQTGDLGPDQYLQFKYNPTVKDVHSVAVTPTIQASSAALEIYNKTKSTSVQWRLSYKHSHPSQGPITLRVVATDNGVFDQPKQILWEAKDIQSDIEYDIMGATLANSIKFSDSLQIGFVVIAPTTFNMDQLQIDDVKVASGVYNKLKSVTAFRCTPGTTCEPTNPGETTKIFSVNTDQLPELVVGINEWYKIFLCYQDPDGHYDAWKFYGFPTSYLDGHPLDNPGFMKPTTPAQGSGFCNTLPGPVGIYCGKDASPENGWYACWFEIKPQGIEDYVGIYRVGMLSRDEFATTKEPHSIFESLAKGTINIVLEDGYLVWSPNGISDPSAVEIKKQINAAGRKAQIITKLELIPNLSKYQGIFAVLGIYGKYHTVTAGEAAILKNYLDQGGKLYLEGGDFFYTFSGNQPVTVVHPYFKIDGKSDGAAKLDGPIKGKSFLGGFEFDYSQGPDFNSWNDRLAHTPEQGGIEVMKNVGSKVFATMVTYEGKPSGKPLYRTIGSSISFGGLIEKGTGTKKELMTKLLYFLENGYPPCTMPIECDDDEVCTDDKCVNGVCVHQAIEGCIPCADDCVDFGGNPSCGPDQACDPTKGYCVPIPHGNLWIKSNPDQGEVPKTFGSSPTTVQSKSTVAQPGILKDIYVKVKVTHAYRGDVELSIGHLGKTIKLKASNPTDSGKNVCETYDIVPLPSGDLPGGFSDIALAGEWTLTAKDTDPMIFNGILDDWHIFGTYALPPCIKDADCNDANLCTMEKCVNNVCQYTPTNCDDGNECTQDSCDPATGECIHEQISGSGCQGPCKTHADCAVDDVCLSAVSNFTVACKPTDTDCECRKIEGTPYVADAGLPVAIPDNNPTGVSKIRTITSKEGPGVVKKLKVKVKTQHTAIGDLKAVLCKDNKCVTLHYLSGGNEDGFYKVFDYDPVDGPGQLQDLKGVKLSGDWTLTVSDLIAGDTGKLTGWTLYIVNTECYQASDCDDGNPCTIDSCVVQGDEGTCLHTEKQCQPINETCKVNKCNPATGQCEVKTQPNGTPCEDKLYCTVDDYCQDGVCKSGAQRDCTYLDDQCIKGVCNEDVDSCIIENKPDGTPCDDGEPCFIGDTCKSGVCVSGNQGQCPCTKDADCKDDGDKCNGIVGKCNLSTHLCEFSSPPVECPPPSGSCKVNECIPSTGECVEKNALNFTPCEDGLYCTVGDNCQNGVCTPTQPRDCSDGDGQCVKGICDEENDKCSTIPKADGTPCELDGKGCTTDKCEGGVCKFSSPIDCSSFTDDCNTGLCQDVGFGGYQCIKVPKPDGTVCTDEPNPCTTDKCQAGVCTHTLVGYCTGPCGGDHPYDAGDDMCGFADSCKDGILGYPKGQCTPSCVGCNMADSGVIDLPIDEKIGCTTSALTMNVTSGKYVSIVQARVEIKHGYLGDLEIDLIDPQGYAHRLWNHIGGSNADFANTFDKSLPVPYTGIISAGVPMCALKGEIASGTWYLRVCDTGLGNGGMLHKWRLYIKGNDTNTNLGHRCEDAIEINSADNVNGIIISGDTTCSISASQGACGGASGRERIYKFTISVPKRVTIWLYQPDRDLLLWVKDAAGQGCTGGSTSKYCKNDFGKGANPELIDQIFQPGTYFIGVDSNNPYEYGTFQMKVRFYTPSPDGYPCVDYLDCQSAHCQNGYCCASGDCCPGNAWPVPPDGTDPNAIKSNPDWISANTICPAQYKENPICNNPAQCQGYRYDANCVQHICKKELVPDDTKCDNTVEANNCGLWKSVYCGTNGPFPPGAQVAPQCPTYCNSDIECDPNAHCDPPGGATLPDTPGQNNMICVADLPNGAASNEDSDCISGHSQNGYCCNTGDCCPTNDIAGATKCPPSYTKAPVCDSTDTCEGHRYDPKCSNYQCSSELVHDDCACSGLLSDNCGLFIPVFCPVKECPATPVPGGGPWHAGDPPCLTTCSATGVPGGPEDDSKCDDIAHCDPKPGDPNSPICQADVPDGYPCDENSDCANKQGPPKNPGHCQNGFCCIAGDCCSKPTDCPVVNPPSNYWAPPVCDSAATCQGHRMDATCINYMCGTTVVDDDTGCHAGLLSDDCGYYLPVYCNGQPNQIDPPCPTSCLKNGSEDDLMCDPNAHCDPDESNPTNSICVPDLPNDEPCNEPSDCISGYCQIHFCCDVGGCCKGCKVTSFTPNFGGGGTNDPTQSGITVQTTWGQPSPAGRSDGANNKVDFGFMSGASLQYAK